MCMAITNLVGLANNKNEIDMLSTIHMPVRCHDSRRGSLMWLRYVDGCGC